MVGPPSEKRNCNAGNEASDRKAFLPNSIAIQKFIRVAISLAAGPDARNLDSWSVNRASENYFLAAADVRRLHLISAFCFQPSAFPFPLHHQKN
jgi:hypothetical protein